MIHATRKSGITHVRLQPQLRKNAPGLSCPVAQPVRETCYSKQPTFPAILVSPEIVQPQKHDFHVQKSLLQDPLNTFHHFLTVQAVNCRSNVSKLFEQLENVQTVHLVTTYFSNPLSKLNSVCHFGAMTVKLIMEFLATALLVAKTTFFNQNILVLLVPNY